MDRGTGRVTTYGVSKNQMLLNTEISTHIQDSILCKGTHFVLNGATFGEGNGNPLQYSCLEYPVDRGAWEATVHVVAKSWT